MRKRAAAVLLLFLLSGAGAWRLLPAQAAQSSCRTFPQTGKSACGKFLAYWDGHGGLTQQGLPITGEFTETSPTNGKTYTVQYFERAVFELHPENQPPNDVLLSLLGDFFYKEKYPAPGGAPGQQPNNAPDSISFAQTGKRLGGIFLDYWRSHGDVRQQGYPISDEFEEKSELNGKGKTYRVQYFERAVFEYHSENQSPYNVLLSQLGTYQLRQRYPEGSPDLLASLRERPLKIPVLPPNSPCPTLQGRQVSPDFGVAFGSGPLYAVFGSGSDATLDLTGTSQEGGWYYEKVLWIALPEFNGLSLVRGRQVDGSNEVRFGQGSDPLNELDLHTDNGSSGGRTGSGWSNWPTEMRLRGPGCYAFQVDGESFSQVITFRVTGGP